MVKSDNSHLLDPKPLKDFIAAQSRKGVACPECATISTVDGGDGRAVVALPNGMGGIVFYVICNACAVSYEKRGKVALPNVWADSCTTPLMNHYAPKGEGSLWIQ